MLGLGKPPGVTTTNTRSFKKCMCVCVWGGGGQINKWAIYMDVLSLHDEICTALLYGKRAGPCMISIAGV